MGGVSVFAVGGLLLTSPVSPVAVQFGDVLVGLGHPHLAAAHYDRVADAHPVASVRERAIHRAVLLHAAELEAPSRAQARLAELIPTVASAEERARLWARLAGLRAQADDLRGAAEAWARAYRLHPHDAFGVDALSRQARALALTDAPDEALAVWRQLEADHPDELGRALLEQGQLYLALGEHHRALDLFERVSASNPSRDVEALAQLGRVTCLERLGQLDEALAELDAADLPAAVRRPRDANLRSRRPPKPRKP